MRVRTKSEQVADWLVKQARKRPLTQDETEQLRRAVHAIYMQEWRAGRIAA